MVYVRGTLAKIASYLYRTEPQNKARFEIYNVIDSNIHPRSEINHVFSDDTRKVIERVKQKVIDLYKPKEIKRRRKRT
jgi:hypothetical protein